MKSKQTIELEKKLAASKEKDKKYLENEAFKKCGFKKGDLVEFIDRERINDYDYRYYWTKKPISNLYLDNGKVYLRFDYSESKESIKVKLFNENDYTLRHSLWNRELDLNDEFQLIVDKPKSTKGDIYKIFRIEKDIDSPIQYYYYNDHGKPWIVTEGEFHVTTSKE